MLLCREPRALYNIADFRSLLPLLKLELCGSHSQYCLINTTQINLPSYLRTIEINSSTEQIHMPKSGSFQRYLFAEFPKSNSYITVTFQPTSSFI